MKTNEQLELEFEFFDTDLPAGGKLRRMEREAIEGDGTRRDTWIVIEKFASNGWRFVCADNQFY